jgi:hypothetical protein
MKFKETNLNKTRLEVVEITKLLAENCPFVRTQQKQGSPGIPKVFRAMALMERYQERGEILTPIMQLPRAFRPLLMEYVNHEGPWAQSIPIDLWITLRNNDDKTHRGVIYDQWWQPGINEMGEEVLEDSLMIYEKTDIEPGETIDLTPHWAARVLRKYCHRACNPEFWNKWSTTIGLRDCWEEVGYRVTLPKIDKFTQRIEVKAPVKQAKRRKAAEPAALEEASL